MRRYLTNAPSSQQVREQQEMRPLATREQVEGAMDGYWKVNSKTGLNERQIQGVQRALQRDFSMVQGPPGTGKTTFLVNLVASLLNLETDNTLEPAWNRTTRDRRDRAQQRDQEPGKILVCAPSNFAADEIVQRLHRDTNIPPGFITRVYARAIEKAHGSRYNGGAAVPLGKHCDLRFEIRPELEEFALHHKTRTGKNVKPLEDRLPPPEKYDAVAQQQYDECHEREELEVLKRSRVVITTCTSAFLHTALTKGKVTKMYRPVNFATAIVDEAAQASEPDVVLPSLLADQRVVVVGDHKQLGPVVPEKNLCKAYTNALEMPFIERMLKAGSKRMEERNTFLNCQYRMDPSIRSFPSKQFYGDSLLDKIISHPPTLLSSIWPIDQERIVFVDCPHPHSFDEVIEDGRRSSHAATLLEGNTSIKNEGEVNIVAETYQRLLRDGKCSARDVAIITPYRAQQHRIREKLTQRFGKESMDTAIGTVHALQGSERSYIIISFVRSTVEEITSQGALPSACDTVVSVDSKNVALRQICESSLGIVSNAKLLNVALTRAKHGLIIVGNKAVLAGGSNDFFDLIDDLKERSCVLSWQQFSALAKSSGPQR
jgi:superfamily I DNA and/or RNA helicase